MERTQVYLDQSQKIKLRKMAKEKGETMAELIRKAIEQYIIDGQELTINKINESAGLWKDRNDINDSDAYINDMRNKWMERTYGG